MFREDFAYALCYPDIHAVRVKSNVAPVKRKLGTGLYLPASGERQPGDALVLDSIEIK